MSQRAVLASAPSIQYHDISVNHSNGVVVLERKSTKEIDCNVMVSVVRKAGVGFVLNSAVRYEAAGDWYAKETQTCFTLTEALKRMDGLSRKLYKVTASRALAGLLHDSVVPATDDIDF